jgi:energy-converting hydrogenase Eha subunit H
MTEWEKQKILKMTDEELAAEIPKWKSDSPQGVVARAEMDRRRHAAVTSTIKATAKPHCIFKWTLFFTVIGAIAAMIAALDAILRWLHP